MGLNRAAQCFNKNTSFYTLVTGVDLTNFVLDLIAQGITPELVSPLTDIRRDTKSGKQMQQKHDSGKALLDKMLEPLEKETNQNKMALRQRSFSVYAELEEIDEVEGGVGEDGELRRRHSSTRSRTMSLYEMHSPFSRNNGPSL